MSEQEPSLAEQVFGLYGLHEDHGKDIYMGKDELEDVHVVILDSIDEDKWTARQDVLEDVNMSEEVLKKHIRFLKKNGFVAERKNPRDGRKRDYIQTK